MRPSAPFWDAIEVDVCGLDNPGVAVVQQPAPVVAGVPPALGEGSMAPPPVFHPPVVRAPQIPRGRMYPSFSFEWSVSIFVLCYIYDM